jgi:hypothetical protein
VRRLWILLGVGGALIGAGCGASVSVSGGVISNNGPYLAAWSRGWAAVEHDSAPYIATSNSPGACNRGGVKTECYETDSHVAADLVRLNKSLRSVPVPSPYSSAAAQTLQAITTETHGLALRMHSLEAGNYTEAEHDAWFTESKVLLTEANALAQQAYASFPRWARPVPAPII